MKAKRYSVAMPASIHKEVFNHLIRKDGQEDLCFALWYPSSGRIRETALIETIILPQNGERKVHGNVGFLPNYLERVLREALKEGAGVALLHSHPTPGWQSMSADDVRAESSHAAAMQAATGLPFLGLTLGTDGAWSARFWHRSAPMQYEKTWCENVRVVGEALDVTYDDRQLPEPEFREELRRTVSSWGVKHQAKLARLKIGIVGVGSVGSIVAEALARTGLDNIKLIDFDLVKTHNLDRLLHATIDDVGRPKVDTLSEALKKSATALQFKVESLRWSVTEESGFREALDCDILFSCVDRPWPRQVLNFISYAHLIPVIDGGIHVRTKTDETIHGANWKSHISGPDRACLECLGQYDPGYVQAEREGRLDDPKYIQTLGKDHPLRSNENVFAFSLSLASFEVLQMLSMVIEPCDFPDIGQKNFHFVRGKLETANLLCKPSCLFPKLLARGDRTGIKVTGKHLAAENARRSQSVKKTSIFSLHVLTRRISRLISGTRRWRDR